MIGQGRNLRHPLFVGDMIEAFRLAATVREAAGHVLLIAGDQPVTTVELIEAICTAFAVPRPAVRVPYAVGVGVAAGVEAACLAIGREPPVSRRSLEFFTTNNAFDISRARTVLGFTPRYSLSAGLAATRGWVEASA
jgi:nucleoside-diphosphate-sugar epimerase